MSKFQTAKKQTLKKWKDELYKRIPGGEGLGDPCGFCKAYWPVEEGRLGHRCKRCPVYRIEGVTMSCESTILRYDNLSVAFALAVLMYIESMEE
jgi:hypothetical protein